MGEFFRRVESRAVEFRRQLSLAPSDRLEPLEVLRTMGIDIYDSAYDIPGLIPEAASHLCEPDCGFSGAGAEILGRRLVLMNPSHSLARQRVTMMEEAAHFLFGHEPSRISVLGGTLPVREYHKAQEREAYAFAAASLLPSSQVELLVKGMRSLDYTMWHFGVSERLVRYRIQTTGRWGRYKEAALART